jgi:hypothetical protein
VNRNLLVQRGVLLTKEKVCVTVSCIASTSLSGSTLAVISTVVERDEYRGQLEVCGSVACCLVIQPNHPKILCVKRPAFGGWGAWLTSEGPLNATRVWQLSLLYYTTARVCHAPAVCCSEVLRLWWCSSECLWCRDLGFKSWRGVGCGFGVDTNSGMQGSVAGLLLLA